jgi:outer membrane protein TolC
VRAQAIASLVRWVGPDGQDSVAGELPDWPINVETLLPHLGNHPELVAFEAKRELAQAAVQEAEADKHPSWDLQFAYERRGPLYSDMVTLQVSVRLPLFPATRDDPLIEAKHAQLRRLSAEQDDMLREHQEQLAVDLAEFQRLDRALTRQRETLLPLAEEKVALAMSAYRASKADLTEVIAARQEQAEARLKEIALTGQRAQSAARLVYTYGGNHP